MSLTELYEGGKVIQTHWLLVSNTLSVRLLFLWVGYGTYQRLFSSLIAQQTPAADHVASVFRSDWLLCNTITAGPQVELHSTLPCLLTHGQLGDKARWVIATIVTSFSPSLHVSID